MKTILLLALSAIFTLSAQAEIQIYKLRYTITRTGGGFDERIATTGWMVSDDDKSTFLKASAKYKSYSVEPLEEYKAANVAGRKKHVSSIQILDGQSKGMTLRGNDSANIGGTIIPGTVTIGGLDAWTTADEINALDEYKGAAILDRKATLRAIQTGQTAEQILATFKTELMNKGFIESDSF